jgi:hypothetical protein
MFELLSKSVLCVVQVESFLHFVTDTTSIPPCTVPKAVHHHLEEVYLRPPHVLVQEIEG